MLSISDNSVALLMAHFGDTDLLKNIDTSMTYVCLQED